MNELTEYDRLSIPMRQVVDALAEGTEPPPGALAALSSQEMQEVQLLSRTARLAVATLNQPDADASAEARALQQAQQALARRGASTTEKALPPSRGGLLSLLSRLRNRDQVQPSESSEEEIS